MTAAENVPEHYARILDHGFVGLVDHMGDDSAIVQAARISIAGQNVKPTSDDRGLIRYLLRKWHTTPFEMVQLKFHAKMPMFVARQWVRHRMASINEMSARYSELPEEFYVPPMEQVKPQATKNKQGRADETFLPEVAAAIRNQIRVSSQKAFKTYRGLLESGVARELARAVLPLNTYTEWYWKTDLHNLFHFLRLRMNPHAQWEIRVYANAMAEQVKAIAPIAFEAFEDFRLNSMTLTAQDQTELGSYVNDTWQNLTYEPDPPATVFYEWKTQRERVEFLEKLDALGIGLT